ncbi:MAG: class II SORL domain-containing protein [Bacteroidales bacterium]|nr:class II SORL domain-containing protein [Bacteroidales bacterium]
MKILIKRIPTILLVAAVIFSLNSCCENNDENLQTLVDTVKKEETVKKTREELIVNRDTMLIANTDSITEFENKHTPEITFSEIDEKGYAKIYVSVGSNGIVHPSVNEHWIDFITLLINDKEIKRIENENSEGSNKHEFFIPLKENDIITVIIGCNLHGIWKNSVQVE